MSKLIDNDKTVFTLAESFRSARDLSAVLRPSVQKKLLTISGALAALLGVGLLATVFNPTSFSLPYLGMPALLTAASLSLLVFVVIGALHSFYLFFRLSTPDPSASGKSWDSLSYPAADVLLSIADHQDVATGVLASKFSRQVCLRSGIYPDDLKAELKAGKEESEMTDLTDALMGSQITLTNVMTEIINTNPRVSEALLSEGVTKETFLAASRWVQRTDQKRRQATRFWSTRRLQAISPLAQDFTYGRAYTLEKFSHRSVSEAVFLGADTTDSAFATDIEAVFNILSRPRDANVLLVGSQAGGIGDILAATKERLETTNVTNRLADRKLYILDTQAVVSAAEESKGRFEHLLQKLLTEATLAGNVVLVIEDLVEFRRAANQLSVNLFGVLETYFDHPELPIIATSSTADYHQHLEGREIMSDMGTVLVHDVDDDTLLKLLGEVAVAQEGEAVCTIGALEATARGARDLITDDQMPHAAVDLFLEIISTHPEGLIDRSVVTTYLSQKTGVPTGEVTENERQQLSQLEDQLRQRVIGQETAIEAVASALRRNRAGVENQDKPIGSFLFMGPTGVGKTETAKTLNRVYFQESGMRRLDMSEYSQPNSIDILRGSSGRSGRLADVVREQPYGVLLLDEFEKADSQVHDLFLQILDEGYFTDGQGRRVSLSNMIIIATSNAGAQQIFSLVEEGVDLQTEKTTIINDLIAKGDFRPELINRFDATVIYHPLTQENLRKITNILLSELKQRLRDQGFRLEIDDKITNYIVEHGYNPEFGARAIQRVIQDTVENIAADKIIDEGLAAGDKIRLSVSDLETADIDDK